MPVTPALRDFLARVAADRSIKVSEADALALARQYGAKGVRVRSTALPLPPSEAVASRVLPADLAKGYKQLGTTMGVPDRAIERTLGQLSPKQRDALSQRAQDRFDADMHRITSKLLSSGDLQAWQRDSGGRILQHLVEQRTLGTGRALRDGDLRALGVEAQRQTAYLSRFADQLAVKGLRGEVVKTESVVNRLTMYGGSGRAQFWQGQQASEAARGGTIIYYQARDDDRTCPACLDAEARSPYLVGASPLPGQVCLGHGRCRCTLRFEYNPAEYRRLTGAA